MPFLSSELIRDVIAGRPAAGSAGRVFFSSDEGKTYRDNGSSWDDVSDAGLVTSVAGRAGVVTLSSTDISGLATSATTDTTNAANITSGTLPAARLPNPSASTLGGIESIAAVSHQFLTSISTGGVPAQAQPADADLATSDITTNNVSITKHGFAPKAPNDATKFLDGTGAYSVPPGTSTVPNFADNETPSGTVNSSNVTFTLAHTPSPSASLILTRQGVIQIPGTDFTLSTATMTFTTAPTTGDLLNAWYRY